MSKQFLYVLCTISYFFTTYTNDLYKPYAQQWVSQYVQDAQGAMLISIHDVDVIKELIQSSLHRAQVTVQVQAAMWDALKLYWQGWRNVIETRLNPTKQMPYAITDEQKKQMQQFWQQLERYEAAGKAYGAVAQKVVYGDALTSSLAKDAVNDMRKEVRVCMVNALSNVKQHLEGLYGIILKNQDEDTIADVDASTDDMLTKEFSIASFLTDYVPNLVMHHFIKADAFYTQLSCDSWLVLEKMQSIGNLAWHAIETARADFYAALLNELNAIK